MIFNKLLKKNHLKILKIPTLSYGFYYSSQQKSEIYSKINKNQFPCYNNKSKYYFSWTSIKNLKVQYDPSKKTQILSLNQEQLDQLAKLDTYMISINFLEKNDLNKSLQYLNFAINDAKNKYCQSINLHMCLLNRKSQDTQFVNTLEQIFFLSQSFKGLKNLDTQKHLKNYLLSLLFHDKQKLNLVIQFVKSLQQFVNNPKLQKKISQFVFFDAINDILIKNQNQTGFSKLEGLPEETFQQKYFKTNNMAWMKYICLKHQTKSESQLGKKIKQRGEQLVKKFLRALFDMEYCVPQNSSNKLHADSKKNQLLIQTIKSYLVENIKQLRFMPDRVKIQHPQSHIVAMNIANILFQFERYEECVYFMKLVLSTALDRNEVQRVGLCLLLLSKLNFKSLQNYEQILLGILQNSQTYPIHIIKECLSLYSQFLFRQGRFAEAEDYANQMMKLQGDLDLQGLLLPQYDFTF